MSNDLPRLGISFPSAHPEDMIALAREADRAGFHFTTTGDSRDDTFALL